MKLNNHGWGFKDMIFYMSILVLFLFIAVFLIIRMYRQLDQRNFDISDYFPEGEKANAQKEVLLYSDLEVKIKNSAVNYIKGYYDKELTNEKVVITLNTLKSNNLIDDLKDIKDKSSCNGYVLVSMNNNLETRYYPYIKCANYETLGYLESYNQ